MKFLKRLVVVLVLLLTSAVVLSEVVFHYLRQAPSSTRFTHGRAASAA